MRLQKGRDKKREKKSTSNDLTKIIIYQSKIFIGRVYDDLTDIIKKTYKMTSSEISNIVNKSLDHAKNTLKGQYNLLNYDPKRLTQSLIKGDELHIDNTECSDFFVYWIMTQNIALYQSLGDNRIF
jgi:anaerobic ribonucleoside-triphosphate reductase